MIQTFTNLFRSDGFFKGSLKNTSILNNAETVNINDIKDMLRGFEIDDCDSEQEFPDSNTVLDKFIESIPEKPSIKVRFKVLVTCHILISDQNKGEEFSKILLTWKGWKLNESIADHKFIKQYHTFIQKLAHNHNILHMCKSRTYPHQKCQNLVIYYKLINLLNFVFSLKELLRQQLTQNMFKQLNQEVYLLIWNDCIALYLFFEQMIFEFLSDYTQLSPTEFKQIYDFIPDFIRCSMQIKEIFKLKDIFDQDNILAPIKWKQITKKQLENLQAYFQNMRLNSQRSSFQKSQSPSFLSSRLGSKSPPQKFKFTTNNGQSPRSDTMTTFDIAKRVSTVEDPAEIFTDLTLTQRKFNFKNFIY